MLYNPSDQKRKGRLQLKKLALLFVVLSVSTAYLIRAFGKGGVWGAAVFLAIWVSVFLYQKGRA